MSGDESDLVKRCILGQAEAMRTLIKRFEVDVFGLSVRMLRNNHDAEDVTQEVFIRVFRSLSRWDAVRPLRPWIMGITVNRCKTWLAKRSRQPEIVDYLQNSPDPNRQDDSVELAAEIQSALADLRPDYRAVFVMFHEMNKSYEEISLIVERPVGTIKTWLHRARVKLLDRLKSRGMVASIESANNDSK